MESAMKIRMQKIDALEVKDFDQRLPLHPACAFSSKSVVKVILKKVDDDQLEERDKDGHTPVQCAARADNVDVIKYFLEIHTPSYQDDAQDRPLLYIAAEAGAEKVIEYLSHDSDFDMLDRKSEVYQPVLPIAAKCGHEKAVLMLLEHSRDIN